MAMVEAVPNFSEGRRSEVVAEIVAALSVPGVVLLDASSDADHNRSVVTVAGEPSAVLEGLFQATATAARRINLFEQRGEHPRLGATDVVPIVPLDGITLEECAGLARQLGQRIGSELRLPVYLYAAAAARPERRALPEIRRGEFEGLLTAIGSPERMPDYGPAVLGPAGAVVVGARPFLVAYNIFLCTPEVAVARRIARQIRESSGGLAGVQAKGFGVGGQAQVSMNLLDTATTPLHVVYGRVEQLARQVGTAIDRSELIGLAPQQVLLAAAAHDVGLGGLGEERTVEGAIRRMAALGGR